MKYYEKLLRLEKVRKSLVDKESEILFDARIDFLISRNADDYYEIVDSLEKDWRCFELEKKLKEIDVKGIVIYGSGHDGRRTKKILENCKLVPKYFCNSKHFKTEEYIEGLEVISIDELLKKYTNYLVVLGSRKYADEMYQLLLSKKFPAEQILYPQYGILTAECGRQYFDIFKPNETEMFVDGGGYNGNTMMDFILWCDKKYGHIYVFEPFDEMYHRIRKRINNECIDRVRLFPNALWNRRENLSFTEQGAGSYINRIGEKIISGIALDEIVKDEKITYIKLDVEGSELKALEGARNTIIKNKPRLAVSIYHKPEDILEIPIYILELVPEYKFYIRHYFSNMWETVLYAEV